METEKGGNKKVQRLDRKNKKKKNIEKAGYFI